MAFLERRVVMDNKLQEQEEIEIFEQCLPQFLQDDINALVEGERTNSTLLDCLYCEVQASINVAFYGGMITEKEADFLRKKYLGLERQRQD